MRCRPLLLIFLLVAPMAALHSKVVPISKSDARSLPERKVKAIVMAQLADLVREPAHATNLSPKRVLSGISYMTRPRATIVPGLCAIDMLNINFRPQEERPIDQDTPVIANGFDATHYFLVRKPTDKGYREAADYSSLPNDIACASSDFFKDAWFRAADEESASDGALLTRRAIAQAGTGYVLDCSNAGVDLKGKCAEALAKLDPETISSIESCDFSPKDGEYGYCYKVYFGDIMLRILASPRAYGPNVKPPLTLLSVEYNQLIVLAHTLQD